MNINKVQRLFGGNPNTFPACPQCSGTQIGMNATVMTCGSCGWYEPINLSSPHHTELTRYKVASSMRDPNGEKFFHYFLPGDMDHEDRNLAERRLLERCTRITSIREVRGMISTILAKAIGDSEFNSAYSTIGQFPDELWVGVHGKKHDHSDMGAFMQDPSEGLFFRIGSFIHNVEPPAGRPSYSQMVNNIASGSSWEILARRRASYSCFIRMQRVTEDMPIWGGDSSKEGPPLYRFTVSAYGQYPIHLALRLDGWTPGSGSLSVVEGKSCEKACASNIHIDESDILGDDVLMQPISWSAFRISGGDRLAADWSPRYMATLYSPRYLVTCAVSEEQNRGEFIARAAVRNVSDGNNVVSLKRVNGSSIEECVENIRKRNSEIQRLEEKKGEVFTMEKEWGVLDTDPLASLMEIRNLTCWGSEIGHNTMVKRASAIFGS